MPTISRPVSGGLRREAVAAERDAVVGDRRLDEVHRRRSDEGRDEEIARRRVERLRRVDLEDPPVAHHCDAMPEGHRLDLIVGDVHGGGAEAGVERGELSAHADPELCVEVRERLVHQERLRLPHDRAAHRYALPLAAGERGRPAVEHALEAQHVRHVVDAAHDLVLRGLPDLQPVAEVLAHGHVRVERVGLEDHGDVPRTGR